jgi:hypothetical protein
MSEQSQNASGRRGSGKKRKHRSRAMPRNLTAQDLDEIGRRRCLMILEVLSGRVPVTDAIAAAKISRGTYYQLEAKALAAMLTALSPSSSDCATSSASKEVEALQAKVHKLETDKRRLERLLQLATKVVKPGPLTTGKGRPPKPKPKPKPKPGRGSTKTGRAASPDSTTPVKPMKSTSRRSTPKPFAVEP